MKTIATGEIVITQVTIIYRKPPKKERKILRKFIFYLNNKLLIALALSIIVPKLRKGAKKNFYMEASELAKFTIELFSMSMSRSEAKTRTSYGNR